MATLNQDSIDVKSSGSGHVGLGVFRSGSSVVGTPTCSKEATSLKVLEI